MATTKPEVVLLPVITQRTSADTMPRWGQLIYALIARHLVMCWTCHRDDVNQVQEKTIQEVEYTLIA
jgi:hypothetical protein